MDENAGVDDQNEELKLADNVIKAYRAGVPVIVLAIDGRASCTASRRFAG